MNIMLKNKKLLGLLAGVMIPLLFLSGCGSMLAENNKASDSFYDAMPGVSTDDFAAEYPEYDYEMDGVYDKDPRKFADAVKFEAIDYDRMLELCHSGAQVLHDRCVELARDHGIRIEVCSAFSQEPGTTVGLL